MHTIMHCCISCRISCLFKNSNRIEPVFAKNPNRPRTHNFEFFPISSNNLKFNKREIDILMLMYQYFRMHFEVFQCNPCYDNRLYGLHFKAQNRLAQLAINPSKSPYKSLNLAICIVSAKDQNFTNAHVSSYNAWMDDDKFSGRNRQRTVDADPFCGHRGSFVITTQMVITCYRLLERPGFICYSNGQVSDSIHWNFKTPSLKKKC